MKPLESELRIQGKQIYLRPITIEDTDIVVRWRNDPRVVQNFIYRKPISKEEHLNWYHNKVSVGKVLQFIICDKTTDKPLGSGYLQNIEEDKKAEYGIFLGETDAFGRGIGSETAKLIVDYSFQKLKLHKLCSRVLANNEPSKRMLLSVGYSQEGYLKDELFIDGKYEDLTFWGIINPEQI